MGEPIKLKLNENYGNTHDTTIKGNVFYKDKYTEYDGNDAEVESLLEQGILVVEGQDEFDKEIEAQVKVKKDVVIEVDEEDIIDLDEEEPPIVNPAQKLNIEDKY